MFEFQFYHPSLILYGCIWCSCSEKSLSTCHLQVRKIRMKFSLVSNSHFLPTWPVVAVAVDVCCLLFAVRRSLFAGRWLLVVVVVAVSQVQNANRGRDAKQSSGGVWMVGAIRQEDLQHIPRV